MQPYLPDSVNVEGIELTRFSSSADKSEYLYSHSEVSYILSLRRDPQGRLEENFVAMSGLIMLTTGWCSFENKATRKQFFQVLDACASLNT